MLENTPLFAIDLPWEKLAFEIVVKKRSGEICNKGN